jgi:hypothetical protein
MKPKKTISANILTVGLVTLLMIGSLVIFQVYSALTKSQISDVQQKFIKPLDGIIKEETVENLVNRRWFNRSELDRPMVINSPEASETGKVVEE